MSLRVERKQDPDGSIRLLFLGAIDDRSDLESAFRDLPTKFIVDLTNVDRMNSIGIKRWVPLFTSITKRHNAIVEGLSYAIVLQANCTSGLFGAAEIRSCNAPYHCTQCRASRNALVTREEVDRAAGAAPPKNCPTCGKDMPFDDLDGYFQFFSL